MNGDWTAMNWLDGKDYLKSFPDPNQHWMGQYIPLAEQKRVWGYIKRAIRLRVTFEAEHQVFRRGRSLYAGLATGKLLVVENIDSLPGLTDTERQRYCELLVRSIG